MKTFFKFLFLLALLGGAAIYGLHEWSTARLTAPLPITQTEVFEIASGETLASVEQRWQAKGWITPEDALLLRFFARYGRGGPYVIRVGEYAFEPGISVVGALKLLASGKALLRELRVIEGSTAAELLAQLRANEYFKQDLPVSPDALMQALGQKGLSPEGQFFPDTYRYAKGMGRLDFLRHANEALQKTLEAEWATRAEGLPYKNAEEALVMASIIEKETGAAHERALIAGVFVNRLRKGMRLQTDPTVIYGLGSRFDGNLRRVDLQTDTPWNTYTRSGLPPTPICLPGRAAIHAALHPDTTPALFFVARGDGTHEFTATLAEHEAAVRKFQLKR